MNNNTQRRAIRIIGIVSSFLITILLLSGCSSSKKILSVKLNEHMEVGWTPRAVFQSPTYSVWFDTTYSNYQPQEEVIERLKRMKDSIEYFIVYGMWCSDSRREIPRFFKIMDAIELPPEQIILVAVDRTRQIPSGVAEEYGITHVPTFIVKYRGIEIGRIVESPKRTIEEDFVEYLSSIFP